MMNEEAKEKPGIKGKIHIAPWIFAEAVDQRRTSMRMMKIAVGLLVMLTLGSILQPTQAFAADDVPRISKEEARALLGKPNVVFLDARVDKAWKGSRRQIVGSVRADVFDMETQAANYGKDATFIVY